MNEPRIFICYYPEATPDAATDLIKQLARDLHAAGATFIIETKSQTDNEFVQFLTRELPTCQWIIFAQTPATLQSSRTSLLYNAARKFLEQGTLQGMIRVIPGLQENSLPIPPAMSSLNAYNLYDDYPKTLEKLLFTFSIQEADNVPVQPPIRKSISSHRQVSSHRQISSPREIENPLRPSPSQFDRPTVLPRRQSKFGGLDLQISRKTWIISLISILAVIAIIASLFMFFIPRSANPVPNPVIGNAYFTSTALINATGTGGINDGIQINLNNLTPPAAGNSYYAWLLPDNDQPNGNILRLDTMSQITNGQSTLTYNSPTSTNLLSLGSRILITEESSSIIPSAPNIDKKFWRYYATIPQDTTGINTGSETSANSTTHLDYMKNLLYSDPVLTKLQVKGGDAYWFLNNTNYINLLADNAWTDRHVLTIQADAVSMLDYMDGSTDVSIDVTNSTVLKNNTQGINTQAIKVGLLNLNAEHDTPPGYIKYLQSLLSNYDGTPDTTSNESTQVLQLSDSLNLEGNTLGKMRQDALALLKATEAITVNQDTNPLMKDTATNTLLNDLYIQSGNMYNGAFDPTTGNRTGGSLSIFDHIQHLASFTIVKYAGQ